MKGQICLTWWLNTKAVLKDLDIQFSIPKRRNGPWVTLKKFPFGELVYDPEEGLKVVTSESRLKIAVAWFRKFHQEHKVPFEFPQGPAVTVGIINVPTTGKENFSKCGFVKTERWGCEWWELREAWRRF